MVKILGIVQKGRKEIPKIEPLGIVARRQKVIPKDIMEKVWSNLTVRSTDAGLHKTQKPRRELDAGDKIKHTPRCS